MNMKPSPLRHLDLSDDKVAADIVAEKARELANAYERIEDLQSALRGLLGLIHLIAKRSDVPAELRDVLSTNPSVTDAKELL